MHNCIICSKPLTGLQTKFCSTKCKHQFGNNKFQSYHAQQKRGQSRRLKLLDLYQTKCSKCGYNINPHCLSFHHLDPNLKSFSIDIRHCSNRSWDTLIEESKKCILLCMNCHTELHNPMGPDGLAPSTSPL